MSNTAPFLYSVYETGALMRRRWLLQVINGPDRGVTSELKESPSLIGAAPAAALVLTDDTVSRYHAEIDLFTEGLRVRDLDSTNGTFLDGEARIKSAFLENGHIFRVGESKIRLFAVDEPAQPTTDPQIEPEGPTALDPNTVGAELNTRTLFKSLRQVALSASAVLFEGEPGVGKQTLARALHALSPFKNGPFVSTRAGQLTARVENYLNEADGGTLFIQDIDRMAPTVQRHLLRVLSQGELRVSGQDKSHAFNVRLCSSATDLEQATDLLPLLRRRLAVVSFKISPLRERPDDLLLLSERFLKKLSAGLSLGPMTTALLRAQRWPGNIPELQRALEQMMTPEDSSSFGKLLSGAFLGDLMAVHKGDVSEAAGELKMSTRALFRQLSSYDVDLDAL